MNAVILAGGQGTRLWPMSRKAKPKQFFSILSDLPMITEVYQRLEQEFERHEIYIATQEAFIPLIKACLPGLDDDQILVEPAKRDSGPAMALAAQRLMDFGKGDEPFVFIPTDHYIADANRFLETIKIGGGLVRSTEKMIDISVAPEFASTNLGYTHIGELHDARNGIEIYSFKGHTEKPDYQTAKEYIESGQYLWHANYYTWTPRLLLEAYKEHAPEIYEGVQQIASTQSKELQLELYNAIPALSIDYAVAEKIDPSRVLIIKGDFGWSDIGAWDVLYDRLKQKEADEQMNVTKGRVMTLDTSSSLIYAQKNKLVATIGMNDLVVIDTEDALLICPKGRSQDVKKMISLLTDSDYKDHL